MITAEGFVVVGICYLMAALSYHEYMDAKERGFSVRRELSYFVFVAFLTIGACNRFLEFLIVTSILTIAVGISYVVYCVIYR